MIVPMTEHSPLFRHKHLLHIDMPLTSHPHGSGEGADAQQQPNPLEDLILNDQDGDIPCTRRRPACETRPPPFVIGRRPQVALTAERRHWG